MMCNQEIDVLLDTSVLWDYLSINGNREKFLDLKKIGQTRKNNALDFIKLFRISYSSGRIKWYYNSLTDHKLKERFNGQWETIKNKYQLERVPIPSHRYDGRLQYDGSALYGGTKGGVLSILITDEKERFDTEHLETALEHNMTHWLTVDGKKIKAIGNARGLDENVLSRLKTMAITPSELLANIYKNEKS